MYAHAHILLLLGCLIFQVSSCSKVQETETENKPVQMCFRAEVPSNYVSKTTLAPDGKGIVWAENETISLYSGKTRNTFTATKVEQDGKVATFSGEASVSALYYAVSPENAAMGIDGNRITVVVPSNQTPTVGSFDSTGNVSVAVTDNQSTLRFYNTGAIVSFTLAEEGVTAIRVEGAGGEIITGRAAVTITQGNAPQTEAVTGAENKTWVQANANFITGETYYLAVLPCNLASGVVITLFKNGKKATLRNTEPLTFTRNANVFLGDLPQVPEGKWKDDNSITIEGSGAEEAGQRVTIITASHINTGVSGYGDLDATSSEAYTHEIFTRLNSTGAFYFQKADGTRLYPNASGNQLQTSENNYSVTHEGVYRIRFNTSNNYLNLLRAESVQYTQEGWKNLYMEYIDEGRWKLSNVPIRWYNRTDWSSAHEDRYKFQVFFNTAGQWQYYGVCNGDTVQPVKGFWDGCFHLPAVLCSDTAGKQDYLADIVLSLNADGYSHTFANVREIPYSGEKFLFDFGNTAHSSSEPTYSPDESGNYWNNIQIPTNGGTSSGNGLSFNHLLYKDGTSSAYSLVLTSNTRSNGKSNGGLESSNYSVTTTQNLGDLGIGTATEDYFYAEGASTECTFELRGLNPANKYRLRLFGSRAATADGQTRKALYTVIGEDTYSEELQITGPNNGNQNKEDLMVTPLLKPNASGVISVKFQKGSNSASGNEFYQLNCMDVEEFGAKSTMPAYESLKTTSAEETFFLHRAPTTGCIFECVSTFSEGPLELTATIGEKEYVFNANCPSAGVAYLVADLYNNTFTFTPLPSLLAEGNAANGFSESSGVTLNYAGHGVYSVSDAVFSGAAGMSPAHPINEHGKSRFTFIKPNNGYTPEFRRDNSSRTTLRNKAWGNSSEFYLNPGIYDITVNLRSFTFSITPKHSGTKRISVMGSSVPYGTGAEDEKGYTWFYSTYLPDGWTLSNICIPGNNTNDLMRRYDELTADGADYVLFALSLGNEGIHGAASQEAIYNQWKTNMQTLISRARAQGKTVAITGNYARGDFNSDDYYWTQKLNLDIHKWDLPSVNLLGTIDDGAGHWASGYQNGDDNFHPNTSGHREMSYALVPSMFDAMAASKALPERDMTGSLSQTKAIGLVPEGTVHSFASAISFKTTQADINLIGITSGSSSLEISGGKLSYGNIESSGSVNDNSWHQVVVSHFYARRRTFIYLDGTLIGSVEEQVAPSGFSFGANGLLSREVFFWRSALGPGEVSALNNGDMLKSSLELYVPLKGGSIANLAISTNNVTY